MQFIMTDLFKPAAAHKAAHAFCALVLLLVAAPRSRLCRPQPRTPRRLLPRLLSQPNAACLATMPCWRR